MPRTKLLYFLIAVLLLTGIMVMPSIDRAVQADPAVTPTLIASAWNYLPIVNGEVQGPTTTPQPPAPTSTPSPTSTSTPTNTPEPTITSTPTSTPTVIPGLPPFIKNFRSLPDVILPGQETTLYWEVTGEYTRLEIDHGVGDVTGLTSIKVKPDETTRYKLTVFYGEEEEKLVRRTTVTIGETGKELLAYEWNGEVPQSERGFPKYEPPTENGDWTSPTNYAEGTLHFYVKIRSMPQPQDMKLQYCVWQNGTNNAEQCADTGSLTGNPGTTLTWLDTVQGMWVKPSAPPIDWAKPRFRDAISIKNKQNGPVSPVFDWSGEDPSLWYPINWHFMVVVVEKGKAFSGWDNYLP